MLRHNYDYDLSQVAQVGLCRERKEGTLKVNSKQCIIAGIDTIREKNGGHFFFFSKGKGMMMC